MRNILLPLLVFALFSCTKKEDENVFVFNNIRNNSTVMGWDQLSYDVEYIALETTDESVFSVAHGLKFDGDFFFVLSMEGVFQFSRDGKFIRKISNQGHGPQEYIFLIDIAIDSENRTIYLYDSDGKLLVYSYEGHFLRSFTVGRFMFSKLFVVEHDRTVIVHYNFLGNEGAVIYDCDLDKTTVNAIGKLPTFTIDGQEKRMYTVTKAVFEINNQMVIHPNMSNSVYSYDIRSKTLEKRYEFIFDIPFYPKMMGKGFMALEESQALIDISEDSKHIFATIGDRGMYQFNYYIIDKETKESYLSGLRYGDGFKSTFRAKYQSGNMIADIINWSNLNYPQGEKPTEKEIECALHFFSTNTQTELDLYSNPVIAIISRR